MEVHHHSDLQHKNKNWKAHFLEFLMLFLAVSLGFLAESFREHLLNKEKEKQSIESVIQCLATDTTQLKHIILENVKVVGHLDSFIRLKNEDLSIAENKTKFLRHSMIGFDEDWYFRSNDAALEQLKSSGMLRLIRKQSIIDSIFAYDFQNKGLAAQQADCYFIFNASFFEYKDVVDLSFFRDTSILKYDLGYGNDGIEIRNVSAVSISNDSGKVKKLFGNAAAMAAGDEAYINLMESQLSFGKRLIALLKKEYHLN